MIREGYEPWNDRTPSMLAGVQRFMDLSWHNGSRIKQLGALPFDWITNWFHLFDFTDGRYAGSAPPPFCAGRIDTALAPVLRNLPQAIRDQPLTGPGTDPTTDTFNLAVATLVRGMQARIATAQLALAVVNSIPGVTIPFLTPDQLVSYESEAVQAVFCKWPELKTKTPLWYYILKEADVLSDGNALGPLGGLLVMETLHAAIEASPISILREPSWTPIWPRARWDRFTMADLIAFSGDPDPLARWPH
jgi:hypothetical protein